jgi:hypothetical protein
MFVENGEETLVQFFRGGQEYRVAMDDETLARLMNDPDVEIGEELMKITRLDATIYDESVPEELRMPK